MIKLQNTQQNIKTGPKPRRKNIISTSNNTNRSYIAALRGSRSDTKELNINLKTITISFLRTADNQNELSQYQQIIFKNYMKMPANFNSLHYIFRNAKGEAENGAQFALAREKLRKTCLNYYRSTEFVKHFVTSARMLVKNKIIILKFLKEIQEKAGREAQDSGWKNAGLKAYQM